MLKNVNKLINKITSNEQSTEGIYNMMSASNLADALSNMTSGMDIFNLSIDDLIDAPDEWNFYSPLSLKKMEELVNSINKNGLLHPIIVWERDNGQYLILSGHNRKKAYEILYETTKDEKYRKIFCVVKKKNDISKEQAKEIIIDTNWVQRELTAIEKAKSIYIKYTTLGRKQKVKDGQGEGIRNYDIIAKQYGISGRHVLNYYKINYLIDDIQKMVETNSISIKAAIRLSDVNESTQKWMYEKHKDKINNSTIFKIKKNMSETEIENILLNEQYEQVVSLKFDIPKDLKNEFEDYIKEFYSKHNLN